MAEKLKIDKNAMLTDFDPVPIPSEPPAEREEQKETEEQPMRKPGRTKKKRETVHVMAYLTPQQYDRLSKLAESQGRSLTKQIGFAIDEQWRRMHPDNQNK